MTNEQTIDDRLKNHPHLRERFNRILDLTEGKSEGPDNADEVEERAIIELQKLGQEFMTQWGVYGLWFWPLETPSVFGKYILFPGDEYCFGV